MVVKVVVAFVPLPVVVQVPLLMVIVLFLFKFEMNFILTMLAVILLVDLIVTLYRPFVAKTGVAVTSAVGVKFANVLYE